MEVFTQISSYYNFAKGVAPSYKLVPTEHPTRPQNFWTLFWTLKIDDHNNTW
jgi:hypothetical protein